MPEGWRLRGANPRLRSGAAARRSCPTPEARGGSRKVQLQVQEWWLCELRRGREELLHVQGREGQLVQDKEQRLCFAGAAVKKHPRSKVRETQVR